MENYPRIQHFAYFRGLAYPYVGLTAEVDITLLMQRMERERIPFFLTVCYCAARAANAVPQLRQRIRGDKIIEFDRCMTCLLYTSAHGAPVKSEDMPDL